MEELSHPTAVAKQEQPGEAYKVGADDGVDTNNPLSAPQTGHIYSNMKPFSSNPTGSYHFQVRRDGQILGVATPLASYLSSIPPPLTAPVGGVSVAGDDSVRLAQTQTGVPPDTALLPPFQVRLSAIMLPPIIDSDSQRDSNRSTSAEKESSHNSEPTHTQSPTNGQLRSPTVERSSTHNSLSGGVSNLVNGVTLDLTTPNPSHRSHLAQLELEDTSSHDSEPPAFHRDDQSNGSEGNTIVQFHAN